jgi:hypothetical protein
VQPADVRLRARRSPWLARPAHPQPGGTDSQGAPERLAAVAHVLVTLNTAVLVVLALHFMKLLDRTSARWAGLVGASLAILGAVMLVADKGALCLTMSALDTPPEGKCALMMPGLLAMFSFKGWLVWNAPMVPRSST